MNKDNKDAEIVSIGQIVRNVNGESLNEDILVFEPDAVIARDDTFPLRFDALMIALVTNGNGKIGIDLREYELKKNSLIVVQPRNYIMMSEHSADLRCSMVACSLNVVEELLPKLTDLLPLLMHHRAEPVAQLSDSDAKGMMQFYQFLRSKLGEPKTPFLRQKVLCMIQAALYEMMDINLRNSKAQPTAKSRKEEIMARFILSVSENFREDRQVAYYAEKLCITPKHLSAVVKEISGRTAGEWIENYVIMESKVLLKTTDKSIQEIAAFLKFASQSFFGKYFKHHTGISPTEYRKRNS